MRKKYIINPKFQYNLIGKFLFLALLNSTVLYGFIWYFFYNFKSEAIQMGLNKKHIFFKFINELQGDFNLIFFIALFTSMIILFIFGVLVSHKIAGPLYRLKTHLNEASTLNDLSTVKFREKDYFRDIEESLNNLVNKNQKNNDKY